VTLDPPVLVITSVRLRLLPTITLPNPSLEALGASWPSATPVPVSAKFGTALEALLAIVAEASNVPAAFGVKLKVRDTLCPAASAAGRLGDVNAKYLLEVAAALMLTGAFPEFVALTVRVLLTPGATLPKFKAKLPRERLPC
jgi:hypothetical protein